MTVTSIDPNWGASLRVDLGFRGRPRLIPGVRAMVALVCAEYLDPTDDAAPLITAVHELLENMVKYSEGESATLHFELAPLEGLPRVTIRTSNRASLANLERASDMLARIVEAPDARRLYQDLVAASGEQEGSGLGLARIRAEAAMSLAYSTTSDAICIEVTRAVQARQGAV